MDLNKKFYCDCDRVFNSLISFLNTFPNSKFLKNYFAKSFESFVYGNLINNFFENLTRENVTELKLPCGKIKSIKTKYEKERKQVKLSLRLESGKTDRAYYKKFKAKVAKDFPEFVKLFKEIEKIIRYNKLQKYLKNKNKELKKLKKKKVNLQSIFTTRVLEVFIQKNGKLPNKKDMDKIFLHVWPKLLDSVSKELKSELDKTSEKMLINQRKYASGFEQRLYKRWKKPIDLLEVMIRVSLDSASAFRISTSEKIMKSVKYSAILRIHSRGLQISNEILALIEAGYADAAYARWRSLHELAVISLFLFDNSEEVSKMYLDHELLVRAREAQTYKEHYKRLNYPQLGRKSFDEIKKRVRIIKNRYGPDFNYCQGYGWIPRTIITDRNFKSLEKKVKLSKLRPFYNLASNPIHGGPKGLYRLGLTQDSQDKVLLVGPTNYGFADALQNTSISLIQVTISLLNLDPTLENLGVLGVMREYSREMAQTSVTIQKELEKDSKKSKKKSKKKK